jgi:hypothetical protein
LSNGDFVIFPDAWFMVFDEHFSLSFSLPDELGTDDLIPSGKSCILVDVCCFICDFEEWNCNKKSKSVRFVYQRLQPLTKKIAYVDFIKSFFLIERFFIVTAFKVSVRENVVAIESYIRVGFD